MANGWRRGFNWSQGGADSSVIDLLDLSAGETVEATWWQASFSLLYNGDDQPLGNSPGKVGLYVGPSDDVPDPFNDPSDPGWIDMAPITWDIRLTQSTTSVWWAQASLGPIGRKCKAMRKAGSGYGLWVSYHVWGNGVPTGWSDSLNAWATADCWIGNVQ